MTQALSADDATLRFVLDGLGVATLKELEELVDAGRELKDAGVAFEDSRMGYAEVQISRQAWERHLSSR